MINLENRDFQVPRGQVVQNQTLMCDKQNCLVCKNKPQIVDGLVNLDVQALRLAANSSAHKLHGEQYMEQTTENFSSGFKVEIKQAPPCPFCNMEFPLHYTPMAQKTQKEPQKPNIGYTYKEAESIIEDKVEPNQFKHQYENAYAGGNHYANENENYYSNQAYLSQPMHQENYQAEEKSQNEIHKSSEELGKEVNLFLI